MKRIITIILLVSVVLGSLIANDFQHKVFEYKKGPEDYKNLEFEFSDEILTICDTGNGAYFQYSYRVSGGTIVLEELCNPNATDYFLTKIIPYKLSDGTAILELDLGLDKLVLYDTGRKQYRSNLAFGIMDKAVVATGLIAGTTYTYKTYNKFYETDKYVKNHDGEAPSGYRGGRQFMNYEEKLPQADRNGNAIAYREYDVKQWEYGVNRGAERLVQGSDGKSYITTNHYGTFMRIH